MDRRRRGLGPDRLGHHLPPEEARVGRAAAQVRYNLPIEMLYTVVPFIMVGVLFFFTARDENYIDSLSAKPNVTVTVVGYQWSWQFQYKNYPVQGSPTGVVTENGEPWSRH